MDFFPILGLGLLNGWIYFVSYLIIFGLVLSTCSKEVKKRLYDKSLWDKTTRIITTIGKLFSLANIIMLIFGRLLIGNLEFYIGTVIYLVGLMFLVISLIHFRDSPLDEPITRGVYKFSRNPQLISIFITLTGMILVIGSWINLIFLGIVIVCTHYGILGEESALIEQYGESYLEYMKKVPRYFIFF